MRTPEELLRAFATGLMIEDDGPGPGGIALIDSGWIGVDAEEVAYLKAMWLEIQVEEECARCERISNREPRG